MLGTFALLLNEEFRSIIFEFESRRSGGQEEEFHLHSRLRNAFLADSDLKIFFLVLHSSAEL